MQKNFIMMTASDMLFEFSTGLVVIYVIILFYKQLGNSIILAGIPFAILHFTHASLLSSMTKHVIKLGIKKALTIAIFFYSLASILIFLNSDNLNWPVLILWGILYAFGNVFHYIPEIYVLGHNTTDQNRGKFFGYRKVLFIIFGIVLPLLGGFISEYFNLNGLMLLCLIFYTTSLIPVLFLDSLKINHLQSLRTVFKTYTAKKIIVFKITQIISSDLNNYWPIFITILFAGNLVDVGILIAASSFASLIISYIVGLKINRRNELQLYNEVSFTNTFAWFIKAFSFNYIASAITDTIYKINNSFFSSVIDIVDYSLLDNSKHKDIRVEFIIIREITINYAKSAGYIIFPLLITVFGFYNSFIIVGIFSFIAMSLTSKMLHNNI